MQHDMMRHQTPAPGSENVGDVLASIRRLIAQDEAGSDIPNQLLNTLPQAPQTVPKGEASTIAALPLKLDSNDLIAPEVAPPDAPASEPDTASAEMRLHLTSAQDDAQTPAPGTFLGSNPWRDAFAGIMDDVPEEPQTTTTVVPATETAVKSETWDMATEPGEADPTPPQTHMTTSAQLEETMQQANASVTPINPAIEAPIKLDKVDDTQIDSGEPHLFARQDKDAQKGTHLRGMIREAIRQELQGEIGNRLSRNLQQMIRHEIELTLRQMCEQE